MKLSELMKLVKSADCSLVRRGSGHDVWINNKTGQNFTIPRHSGKEIPTGTAESILKCAGLK